MLTDREVLAKGTLIVGHSFFFEKKCLSLKCSKRKANGSNLTHLIQNLRSSAANADIIFTQASNP